MTRKGCPDVVDRGLDGGEADDAVGPDEGGWGVAPTLYWGAGCVD